MIVALDSETTGLDFYHGARPFLVTTASKNGQAWWEWDVDPLTRQLIVPNGDLDEIKELIEAADELVLQNSPFDCAAVTTVLPDLAWPWEKTHDLLIAGHVLASSQPHDLTSMGLHYLGVDIEPYEKRMEEAVQKARRLARSKYKDWRIAKPGLPEMPSAKEKTWKVDVWLLKALRKVGQGPKDWDTIVSDYANADSAVTLALWPVMKRELEKRGYWKVYLARLKSMELAYEMKRRGVTGEIRRHSEMLEKCAGRSAAAVEKCVDIAASFDYELTMPKAGRNKSLDTFVWETLKLEKVYDKKTGSLTMDSKTAIPHWLASLPHDSQGYEFIKALAVKRANDAALGYLAGYERFWLPAEKEGWFRLHPGMNPCGSDTLRWTSSNPNGQNFSSDKGGEEGGDTGLRYCFGPMPGREWWKYDAKNLELRIPAYEAGETGMIDLFERPNDPPYYGSHHLLVAHILHPDKFAECRGKDGELDGRIFKKKYESTWYRWVKMGNFSIACGAVKSSGTADRAFRVPGAQSQIEGRMTALASLAEKQMRFAVKHGYVETIPDRTVDPDHGYPLMVQRTSYGKVLPTTPYTYHVQGSAMWFTLRAMTKCAERLAEWRQDGFDAFITLQPHDELVFDFPAGRGKEPWKTNLPLALGLKRLMESVGQDFVTPIKLEVSCEYVGSNYSEGRIAA